MIGIYGGTFDPVHFGHLRPALDVYSLLTLSKILFIPCGQPPHRDAPIASSQDRLVMLELALENQPDFVIDDREINRPGASYMIDTIKSLMEDFKDEKFCLIIGMDAFVKFDGWKDWQEITKRVSLVVTQRPGYKLESTPSPELNQYLTEKQTTDKQVLVNAEQPHCFFCPVTQIDIAATEIRVLVSEGKSIDYLLPEGVANFIHEKKLYR